MRGEMGVEVDGGEGPMEGGREGRLTQCHGEDTFQTNSPKDVIRRSRL